MYLDEFDVIKLDPIDTFDINDAGVLRLVKSLDGKKFMRTRSVSRIDKSFVYRTGGYQFDEAGNKFWDGAEEVSDFNVRSDDSEFYAFQFWFNMFLVTKDAELFFTRVEKWVSK
jgi:hypothetical protein